MMIIIQTRRCHMYLYVRGQEVTNTLISMLVRAAQLCHRSVDIDYL